MHDPTHGAPPRYMHDAESTTLGRRLARFFHAFFTWGAVALVLFVVAAVAWPAYRSAHKRDVTAEAVFNLRRIASASATYFETHQRFPDSQARAPSEPVGEWPMPPERFDDSPTWRALQFGFSDRFMYQYQYDSTNNPTDPSHSTFTASAFGDLDGDGVLSTFVRFGSVSGMQATNSGGLYIAHELE